jgi:hypothetical protein
MSAVRESGDREVIAMIAIEFGLPALGWALASWVYFDATERGKPWAFLWGLAVLLLGWTLIPLIVYLSVRNQPPRFEVADQVAVRQYLVTTALTSIALTVAGGATALAAALVWAVSKGYSTNDFRDLLASSLAAALVGAAIWVPHWQWLARRLDGELPDAEFRALYALRRSEVLTATFLFGGLAALTTLWVLGGALSALLQASYAAATLWLPFLGPALACATAATYHARYYLRMESSEQRRRFERLPAPSIISPPLRPVPWTTAPRGAVWVGPQPPATPADLSGRQSNAYGVSEQKAPSPAPQPSSSGIKNTVTPFGESDRNPGSSPVGRFCGKCGTPSPPGDQFCRACGTRLGTPSGAITAA